MAALTFVDSVEVDGTIASQTEQVKVFDGTGVSVLPKNFNKPEVYPGSEVAGVFEGLGSVGVCERSLVERDSEAWSLER